MKVIIKGVWAGYPDFNLETYLPADPEVFGLWVDFKVGPIDSAGADDFRLFVCSHRWLQANINGKTAYWGRHSLFMSSYDLDVIKFEINKMIENCKGDRWDSVAEKISRFAAWEFEGYRE